MHKALGIPSGITENTREKLRPLIRLRVTIKFAIFTLFFRINRTFGAVQKEVTKRLSLLFAGHVRGVTRSRYHCL